MLASTGWGDSSPPLCMSAQAGENAHHPCAHHQTGEGKFPTTVHICTGRRDNSPPPCTLTQGGKEGLLTLCTSAKGPPPTSSRKQDSGEDRRVGGGGSSWGGGGGHVPARSGLGATMLWAACHPAVGLVPPCSGLGATMRWVWCHHAAGLLMGRLGGVNGARVNTRACPCSNLEAVL